MGAAGFEGAREARPEPSKTLEPSLPSEEPGTTTDGDGPLVPGTDAVESALAEATDAGRWDIVAQLARDLEARRAARELKASKTCAGNVLRFDAKLRKNRSSGGDSLTYNL